MAWLAEKQPAAPPYVLGFYLPTIEYPCSYRHSPPPLCTLFLLAFAWRWRGGRRYTTLFSACILPCMPDVIFGGVTFNMAGRSVLSQTPTSHSTHHHWHSHTLLNRTLPYLGHATRDTLLFTLYDSTIRPGRTTFAFHLPAPVPGTDGGPPHQNFGIKKRRRITAN